MKQASLFFLIILITILALGSCRGSSPWRNEVEYYLSENDTSGEQIKELFELLYQEEELGEARFPLVNQIANHLLSEGESEKCILFLSSYVERFPDDPLNAYYLLIVARAYKDARAFPMARHYYRRILSNYSDIEINRTTAHLSCLKELIKLTDSAEYRIWYYRELLDRFGEEIDRGATYYHMAKCYEEIGQWDKVYESYRNFMEFPDTIITGNPEARTQVESMIKFYDSGKDWTMESLEELVNAVRYAIYRRDVKSLLRYKAKVNFSARSWEQKETDEISQTDFEIGIFLGRGRVHAAAELDLSSNAREAYLRTWGWSHRVDIWYLYFRRIDFPANPEINGRWEWAGILFGEKF